MTNRYLFITLFLFSFVFTAAGQGQGKLTINADLSSIANYDPEIEVSVINLATNREMIRKSVNEDFEYTFPLNGKFMLYFRKEGTSATRLMLDTHTFMSGYYTFSFDLTVGNSARGNEVAALPIGTIKFDRASTRFGYKAANLLAVQPLQVVSTIRESDVVKF